MFKEGIFSFLVLLFFFLTPGLVRGADLRIINYTIMPSIGKLSGYLEGNTSYKKKYIGGFHNLAKTLFPAEDISLNYIPYNSYDKALQQTMIYNNSDNNPEIILGALFDEDKLEYLEYIPIPIYTDYKVVVLKKENLPSNIGEFKKNLQALIENLSQNKKGIIIKSQNFKEIEGKIYDTSNTIDEAMEKVFLENRYLITTWSSISDYIERNKKVGKLNTLSILQYPKNSVYYFIALNKNSKLLSTKTTDGKSFIDDITDKLTLIIQSSEINKILEN